MADTSERIIILSAVVLVIILWISNSGLIRTIVTIDDLEIEIVTSRDNYTLGENFTANVYLVNTRSRNVWMEPINAIVLTGIWEGKPAWGEAVIDFMNDTLHIPSKSKVFLVYRRFTPIKTGEFIIQCSGVRKTVLILEPDSTLVDYIKEENGDFPINIKAVDAIFWNLFDVFVPERALSHGIKGYINISYVSEMPARVIVSPGRVINYTIRLELISHVPEFTETEVVFDPENSSQHGAGWGDPVPIFNHYIHYSPNGTILLRVDELLNVTMILSVPDGFTGMSAYPRQLIGVGIMADVYLMDAYGGGGFDGIIRDEG